MTSEAIQILKKGGIGVIPTDTLYGVVGSALNPETVQRIYEVKGRNENKPFIILISAMEDLEIFGVRLSDKESRTVSVFWPGKISIILPGVSEKFSYLHRGTNSLAFRLPKNQPLIELLKKTGPLVAPSANPEGKTPAKTVKEAESYFGSSVDFYESREKEMDLEPSMLVSLKDGRLTFHRGNKLLFLFYLAISKLKLYF